LAEVSEHAADVAVVREHRRKFTPEHFVELVVSVISPIPDSSNLLLQPGHRSQLGFEFRSEIDNMRGEDLHSIDALLVRPHRAQKYTTTTGGGAKNDRLR
jgi:hypothetical protein